MLISLLQVKLFSLCNAYKSAAEALVVIQPGNRVFMHCSAQTPT
jgi:hypothetical protein